MLEKDETLRWMIKSIMELQQEIKELKRILKVKDVKTDENLHLSLFETFKYNSIYAREIIYPGKSLEEVIEILDSAKDLFES